MTPRIDRIDKNFIINGAMEYWQRVAGNVTTVNTASSVSTHTSDRFFHFSDGPSVKNYSVGRNTSIPTIAQSGYAFPASRRFTCLTALGSFAAGDRVVPHHYIIEGIDCRLLVGQVATLGFWVNCSLAGTYPVNFMTNSGTRTYMTTFTIGAGEINTWVFRAFTLQFENNIPTDNGPGVFIRIGAHSGSTFRTATVGAWQAGNFDCTTTSTNIMSVVNSTMSITGVQLVLGSALTAGSFSLAGRDQAGELQLCQRYYEKSYDVDVVPGTIMGSGLIGIGSRNSTTEGNVFIPYKVTKRITPILTTYSAATGAAGVLREYDPVPADRATALSFNGQFQARVTATIGGSTGFIGGHFAADAEF